MVSKGSEERKGSRKESGGLQQSALFIVSCRQMRGLLTSAYCRPTSRGTCLRGKGKKQKKMRILAGEEDE